MNLGNCIKLQMIYYLGPSEKYKNHYESLADKYDYLIQSYPSNYKL